MSTHDSDCISKLVQQAMELAVADRGPFLDRECGEDGSLRATVEQHLARHELAAGTLGRPSHAVLPERIGPYRLTEVVGEGAMGIVYHGIEDGPLRREVAIKVVRTGVATREVIARLESERQTLALMNHPNIARVLDAGVTDDGLPYFAMELVDGTSIHEFCETGCLTVNERLDLFRQVCDGVQHAHRNAIIHRDLKPTNILVTLQDGRPVPKIIDFGVARAIGGALTKATGGADPISMTGTLAYMSPEQLRSDGAMIDTRTDVYSLGVLLYELLVGHVPFADDPLSADAGELRRRICEDAPRRPSDWLERGGMHLSEVAGRRSTSVKDLARRLHGDLDCIALTALAKDPARRYGSPQDLAADIDRHLADEPVLARKPTWFLKLRKFAKRHRAAVFTTVTFLAVVGALTGSMVAQAGRVRLERERADHQADVAETVSSFLVDLLDVGSPTNVRFDRAAPAEILDSGVAKLGRLEGHPVLHGRMLLTMGELHRKMGFHGRARPILEEARDRLVALTGPEDPAALDSAVSLARLYADQGRYDDAEELFVTALEGRRQVLGFEHPDTSRAAKDLAMMYKAQGRYVEAEATMQEALRGIRAARGDGDEQLLLHRALLGGIYIDLRRYEEAETILRDVRNDLVRAVGARHLESLAVTYNLGCVHARRGEVEEAMRLVGEAIDGGFSLGRPLFEDPHLEPLHGVAGFEEIAHRMWMNAWGARHRMLVQAQALDLIGLPEAARGAYRDVLEGQRRALGDDHPNLLGTRLDIAATYVPERRWDELESQARALLTDASRVHGDASWLVADVRLLLAGSRAGQNRFDDAAELCAQSLETYRREGGARSLIHWTAACCHTMRGDPEAALGELELACDMGLTDPYWLKEEPMLAPLRGDPRFDDLVRRVERRPVGHASLPGRIEPPGR